MDFVPLVDPREEDESLLRRLGAPLVSGLAAVGNVLDLPSSMLRDALAWKNPLDQLLHPLSHTERGLSTSGRDLLTQYGLAQKNKETGIKGWFEDPLEAVRDIAGFGVEVGLDFPGYGLLKQGIKAATPAAKAAGAFAASTRPGAAAVRATKPSIDWTIDNTLATFSRPVLGAIGPEGRQLGRAVSAAKEGAAVASRETTQPLIEGYSEFLKGFDSQGQLRAHEAMVDALEGVAPLPKEMAHLQPLADEYRRIDDLMPIEAAKEGVPLSFLADSAGIKHVGRERFYFPDDAKVPGGRSRRVISGKTESAIEREEFLKDMWEGTGLINRLSKNPELSGIAHGMTPKQLADKSFWKAQRKKVQDALEAGGHNYGYEHIAQLTRWLADLNPKHAAEQIGAFPHNPIETLARRHESLAEAMAMARTMRETMKGNLFDLDSAPVGAVKASKAFAEANLDVEKSMELLRGAAGIKQPPGAGTAPMLRPATGQDFKDYDIGKVGSTEVPTVKPTWNSNEFRAISTSHDIFDSKLIALRKQGYLSETDLSVMRVIFSQMNQEGLRKLTGVNIRLSDKLKTPEGVAIAGEAGWDSTSGFRKYAIDLSRELGKGPAGVGVLLHELGHIALWQLSEMDNPYAEAIQGLLRAQHKSGELAKVMTARHGETLGKHLSGPMAMTEGEPFAQMFADSLLSRKVPQGVLAQIISDARDWIVQFLGRLRESVGMPEPIQKKIDELLDLAMGFKVSNKPAAETAEEILNRGGRQASRYRSSSLSSKSHLPGNIEDDLYIPKEIAENVGRVSKAVRHPEQIAELLKPLVGFTKLWKSATFAHPAFHVRNRMSGLVNNFLAGMVSPKTESATKALLAGKTMQGIDWQKLGPEYKGLSDEAATKLFAKQAYADDIAPRGQGQVMEDFRGTALDRNLAADIPGHLPLRASDALSQVIPKSLGAANPLDTENFAPYIASRTAGAWTEGMNRIAPYLKSRLDGLSRAEARTKVRAWQIDYTDMTDVERNYIRPFMPFYGFQKGIVKKVASELTQNPTGPMAQSIRAQHLSTAQELPLPAHVGQSGAIPWSEQEDGTKRYVTSLGLMHEDPLALVSGGDPLAALTEVASRAHPLAKLPIELAFGESLFQRGMQGGRELSDADPSIGRLLTNLGIQEEGPTGRAKPLLGSTSLEHILANMPTNRLVTTLRTLTDPRKDIGDSRIPGYAALLPATTGLRITDVSPESQQLAIRQHADKIAREDLGARQMPLTYIPKEEIAYARRNAPEAAIRMDTYNDLKRTLDRERRQQARREAASRLLQGAVGP